MLHLCVLGQFAESISVVLMGVLFERDTQDERWTVGDRILIALLQGEVIGLLDLRKKSPQVGRRESLDSFFVSLTSYISRATLPSPVIVYRRGFQLLLPRTTVRRS